PAGPRGRPSGPGDGSRRQAGRPAARLVPSEAEPVGARLPRRPRRDVGGRGRLLPALGARHLPPPDATARVEPVPRALRADGPRRQPAGRRGHGDDRAGGVVVHAAEAVGPPRGAGQAPRLALLPHLPLHARPLPHHAPHLVQGGRARLHRVLEHGARGVERDRGAVRVRPHPEDAERAVPHDAGAGGRAGGAAGRDRGGRAPGGAAGAGAGGGPRPARAPPRPRPGRPPRPRRPPRCAPAPRHAPRGRRERRGAGAPARARGPIPPPRAAAHAPHPIRPTVPLLAHVPPPAGHRDGPHPPRPHRRRHRLRLRLDVMRRPAKLALGALAVFGALQLVPLPRTNPPVTADFDGPPEVERVLRQSCYDCHSNETRWTWTAYLAPVSWL